MLTLFARCMHRTYQRRIRIILVAALSVSLSSRAEPDNVFAKRRSLVTGRMEWKIFAAYFPLHDCIDRSHVLCLLSTIVYLRPLTLERTACLLVYTNEMISREETIGGNQAYNARVSAA